MASKAATEEGVDDKSCGLPTSFRIRSLDVDSLLFLRCPFLILVGITTGLVVDWGVRIFGGVLGFASLSFRETRSTPKAGVFPSSLCLVDVSEGDKL